MQVYLLPFSHLNNVQEYKFSQGNQWEPKGFRSVRGNDIPPGKKVKIANSPLGIRRFVENFQASPPINTLGPGYRYNRNEIPVSNSIHVRERAANFNRTKKKSSEA